MAELEPCWSLVAYITGTNYQPTRLMVLRHGLTSCEGLDYISAYRHTFKHCVLEIGFTKHFTT